MARYFGTVARLLLIPTIGAVAILSARAAGQRTPPVEQEVAVEEIRVEDTVEPETTTEIVESEPVKTVTTPREVAPSSCPDDIPCFISAVSEHRTAHYSGESNKEPLPGVTASIARTWDFQTSLTARPYTFVSTISDADVKFADDWFDTYLVSDAFPAELQQQIDDATYLTEEELNAMDDETRASYEQQIASGKTPQDITEALVKYSLEQSIWTSIVGTSHTTQTCSLTDVAGLVAVLKNWEQGIFSSSDLDFAVCRTRYQ